MRKWLGNLLKTYFLGLFPYVIVFLASLFNSSDSDLGWHLKYGEYFFQHFSVLRENIFSTDLVNYQWINSSWATDLLSYFTFHHFGFMGLTILAGMVVTAALFFFAQAARLSFWEKAFILPIVVFLEEPLTSVSFRGHLLTLLFLSILFFLLKKFQNGEKKALLFVVPLFMFWSNFHGEFILGIGLLLLWIVLFAVSKIIQKQTFLPALKYLIFIPLASFIATLINPFGLDIYTESLRHFGNPLQKYVIEWLPLDKYSSLWWQLVAWGLVIFIGLMVIKKQKLLKKEIPFIGVTIILYILAFCVRMYAWPMYLISIMIVSSLFKNLKPKNETLSSLLAAIVLVMFYIYSSLIKFPAQNIGSMSWEKYCEDFVKCSPKSAEFLAKNNLSGRILTFYNWGGWLIWNYPEIKPSIDGRMHLWQDENGYSAFMDYYPYEQNWKDIDKSKYTLVYMTPQKPLHKQMMKKVEEGKLEIIYKDKYAYIFRKK